MSDTPSANENMRDTLHPVFTIREIKEVMEVSEKYYIEYREYWDETKDFIEKCVNKLKANKNYKIDEEENEVIAKRFELLCNYEHQQKEISYMIEENINFLNGKTKNSLYNTVCNSIYKGFTTDKEINKRVKNWLKSRMS